MREGRREWGKESWQESGTLTTFCKDGCDEGGRRRDVVKGGKEGRGLDRDSVYRCL